MIFHFPISVGLKSKYFPGKFFLQSFADGKLSASSTVSFLCDRTDLVPRRSTVWRCMCVCGLFKENINILDYITSIGRMVVVKDMEGSGHSERIIGVVAQIQTR